MSTTSTESRILFLFDSDPDASSTASPTRLGVPPGPSTLTFTRGGNPRISGAPRRVRGATSLLIEPVSRGGRPYLLVVRPRGPVPRKNGLAAPRIAVLGVGDQLRHGRGPVLHVSVEVPDPRRRAGAEHEGVDCPLCCSPIEVGRWIHVCSTCGTAMHDEGEDVAASARLACARLAGRCRGCDRELNFEGGLLYTPEE